MVTYYAYAVLFFAGIGAASVLRWCARQWVDFYEMCSEIADTRANSKIGQAIYDYERARGDEDDALMFTLDMMCRAKEWRLLV